MAVVPDILVVDDEAPIRMLWERFLTRWGYAHLLAENGQAGLRLLRQTPFQLVITDLTMPVMSGQELIHILKREQPEVEVIVTTGHGTIEVAVELMKAGVFDFITKPISFNHAELIVKKCLDQIRSRRENERLRQMNRDLEALNRIKEKFIAITNHELRTPVSVLSNVVEILGQELKDKDLEPLVRIMERSSHQLTEIVSQMHELSGVKSTRLDLHVTQFPVANVVEEVQEEFALTLQRRKQTARREIPAELLLSGDRAKFKKVVRELVQNAIKFTPDGGEIVVSAQAGAERRVELKVRDTGIGIAGEHLDHIFDLFYEAGDTLHHHTSHDEFLGGGMGVGLSIVRDIVVAHGGELQVASEPGKGSTFTVILPQSAQQA
jgi:signal transduction histidine kinase